MNLEIQKPELMQRVIAYIENGEFSSTDDLIEKALDALENQAPLRNLSSVAQHRAAGRPSLVELFAPLRGMNLTFERNRTVRRALDLE